MSLVQTDSPSPALGADLAHPRTLAAASLGVALLASVPSWFSGFANDDLSQRLLLEGALPGYTVGWLGLYDFTPPSMPTAELVARGVLPWFSHPDLELRFLRPLASLTLALDHALFGRNALLAHLHSGLWMLALAFVAAQLYRRWLPARAAVLAAVLFALSPVHGIPLSWLASRHTLVSATFGALSLWAWLRPVGGVGGRGLALAFLAASLLSSESGLVTVTLIVSIELARVGLRRGLVRAALPLGVGLAYLLAYAGLGYGARNSSFYISPFDAPLEYLQAALLGVPALAAELLLGVPSTAAGIGGRPALLGLAALGVASAGGAVLWLRALGSALSSSERRELGGLCAGALLGLSALTGSPVSGRVLPLPALATAALAAVLLERTWSLLRGSPSRGGATPGRWRWRAALALGALFQLVVSPLTRVALALQIGESGRTQERLAREADVGACAHGGSLYLVNGSDPTLALYAAAALLFYTPEKAGAERLRVLSMAPQPQRLTRPAPGALLLEVLGDTRRSTPFEQLFRGPDQPLEPGLRVALPELDVRVEATRAGLFTRARFERAAGFDAASTCLLVWRNGRLEHERLPAVGASVMVEHQPGPMGL
ncbi:MAG TPA: hypothetical protein VNN80_05960 [Polyangiaceae bacterium]|nr:hypothetical protein [Polyangiaceae bacterium]